MAQYQCNCGAVSFDLGLPPADIYVCHCSICRRFSGGAGMPVVVLQNDAFQWLTGAEHVRVWKKPDVDWEANFCAVCGSALPGRNSDSTMFVPAGLLPDEAGPLEVRHHIFVGSRAKWDHIADGGKTHEGRFGG